MCSTETEKCQKEGENCAQDLNPVTKCCEGGLECQIEPNGWGSCEKKSKSPLLCHIK